MSQLVGRTDLPRTDDVAHPTTWPLDHLRDTAKRLIERWYDLRLHGVEHVPASGPVIVASNHVGIVDGPLLAICSPRPVHALTKSEMFEHGALSAFLHFSGQIPVYRAATDMQAIKVALKVLREGHAMGIYPEGARGAGEIEHIHGGAAYFALVTGAPVVPVVMLGSREPGGGLNSLPPRGSRIDMVFGEPFSVPPIPWPRDREQVDQTSKLLHQHMQVHLDHAKALTGRSLPGPLPPHDQGAE